MTRRTGLLLIITIISIVSGYLLSKASLVGKAGMSLFYREYNFLKTWWKGGLLIFALLIGLYLIHNYIQKRNLAAKARTIHIAACIISLIGLYFTYNDFRHTLSHRLLGERFHLGVYLFWIGWIIIAGFFISSTPGAKTASRKEEVNKT